MALYHVTGEILYPSPCNCNAWKRQKVDRIVNAVNSSEALTKAVPNVPSPSEWIRDPSCRMVDLHGAELIELARWNAGSPTSSPFALATARGEL